MPCRSGFAVISQAFADGLTLEVADELVTDFLWLREGDGHGINGAARIAQVEVRFGDVSLDAVEPGSDFFTALEKWVDVDGRAATRTGGSALGVRFHKAGWGGQVESQGI